jgi:hypothetical protein
MVIPAINLGLRPNIPTVDDISGILSIIRAGELRDVSPALGSVRAFARAIGINESTLRSAYLTEGRRPSVTTQARVDAAIRQNAEALLGRRVLERSVVDRAFGRNPLARLYLEPPPGVRRVRIIVRTDPTQVVDSIGRKYDSGYYTVTLEYTRRAFEAWQQLLPPTETVDAVIWQYEEREREIPVDLVD